ncbi:MAG: hypothetical protein ACYC35_03005 [Pirellulales bacterium]
MLPVFNFRQNTKPRNYLGRREQWRLLVLVMSVGLVALLMLKARDPRNWQWIAGGKDDRAAAKTNIDTRLHPASPDEPPGMLVSPIPLPTEPDAHSRYFPGVQPDQLKAVRDDTFFRPQETDACFQLLGLLAKTDESALGKASTGPVTFAQLYQQPREYRGELVTTRGILRRAQPGAAVKNRYGVSRYYDAWLFPADNPASPIEVYCLELPPGFPTGKTIAEEVEVTGFFFKRLAYNAPDGLRTAPLLLAKTVAWRRPPAVEETSPGLVDLFIVIAAAAIIAAAVVLFVYRRGRQPELDRQAKLPESLGPLPEDHGAPHAPSQSGESASGKAGEP